VFWGCRYRNLAPILKEGLSTLPKLQPALRQVPSSTSSNSCAGESCAVMLRTDTVLWRYINRSTRDSAGASWNWSA
jgi:hypothetical protein